MVDRNLIDFTCRPFLRFEFGAFPDGQRRWLEVACDFHVEPFQCGHHHRQWDPISRCMARHVQEHTDGD